MGEKKTVAEAAVPASALTTEESAACLSEKLPAALLLEARASFDYLWEQTNHAKHSPGYGLTRDRYPGNPAIASTAATGFALAAIPVGVENGWIGREEGFERADRTMDTLLAMEHERGFFYHFVNIDTGKRVWNCEISSVDTALLIAGALTAGQYFGGSVQEKSGRLYERIDWPWFVDPNRNQFCMAYYPETGFQGYWDFYAEQLLLYVLAAGSPTHPVDAYGGFIRRKASYRDSEPFIHSWFGSIFTHQFSHAWIDFRNLIDREGVDWFRNSVIASEASRRFAADLGDKFKGVGEHAWGFTASDTPNGYNGLLGSPPSGCDNSAHRADGTVAAAGALGSVVFTPEASLHALEFYLSVPNLSGEYGLKDAFNLEAGWTASDYIGIDKGITLLMAGNYGTEAVWKIFMEVPWVKDGLNRLGFRVKEDAPRP